jgi:predicted GTPase
MIEKVVIMGAAGRDFHNFNVYFKDNAHYRVVAFTAAQIPDIDKRLFPAELAGKFYQQGIPIYPEDHLADLIRDHNVDLVAFPIVMFLMLRLCTKRLLLWLRARISY